MHVQAHATRNILIHFALMNKPRDELVEQLRAMARRGESVGGMFDTLRSQLVKPSLRDGHPVRFDPQQPADAGAGKTRTTGLVLE
jgi:hypothetical protein